jgi:hypothetical protein
MGEIRIATWPLGRIGRRYSATVAALAAAGLAAGMLLVGAEPAAAASCPAATATTSTFCNTGAAQTWTVPATVTVADFTLYGADGGGTSPTGGQGAQVTGTLPVTPGSVLQVDVGQAGTMTAGGFGGGGDPAGHGADAGGGGGASYVVSPTAGSYPFSDALLLAAGGGGAGSDEYIGGGSGGTGGNAGSPGEAGSSNTGYCGETITGGSGGGAGSSTTGGTGGAHGVKSAPCSEDMAGLAGTAGAVGTGGNGGLNATVNGIDIGGGGGGGGWYGGGGGGSGVIDSENTSSGSGSGGGGSSYTGDAVNTSVGLDGGESPNDGTSGEVVISYPLTVTASLPAGNVGTAYSATLTAANGTSPYSWTLTSGALPTGLSLASDGTISGTPTTTGTADFAVVVQDSSSPALTAAAKLSIAVNPQPLTVTTTSLPGATAGTAYRQQLSAAGGKTPYSWALTSGALPTGLSLSAGGVISGTPIATGTSDFTVLVVDSSNPELSASAGLSIEVGAATPQVALSASPTAGNATVDTAVSLTATVAGVAGVAAPTGSVTFGGQAASCGTVALNTGTASCSLGDLAVGSYTFTATYSGDSDYLSGPTESIAGYSVSLVPTAVSITQNLAAPVYGQPVSLAAAVTSGGEPVRTGTVQWLVDGSDEGSALPLSPNGTVSFMPQGVLSAGVHAIEADYSGTSTYATASLIDDMTVAKASTRTNVAVTASALTATVTAVGPGAGTPTGDVSFTVDGTPVGTAALNSSGVATLAHSSSGSEPVSASYGGDADFLPSSGSVNTVNPVITASVSSKHAESKYGWYQSPVTVSFTCAAGSAPLTGPCPNPVTLTTNGADQTVTETIHGTDGGVGTVSVTVSIDQTAPKIGVAGIKNKTAYDAPGPAKITCHAAETVSGLAAPCKVTVKRTEAAITWTATATSKAGVTATLTGKAALLDFYVAGAKLAKGRFLITEGKAFTLDAYVLGATKAPKYVYAVPAGHKPAKTGPAMRKAGSHLWAIRVTIITKLTGKSENWTIGILVGRHLYAVPITLRR